MPVEMEKIGKMIDAAIHAPNAGNLQNWGFIIVRDPGKRTAIAEACLRQMWIASAPVVLVVCSQTEKGSRFYGLRGERLYNIQNCAAAAENILLAAHAMGMGGCWVGAFEEEMLARACGIPGNARPQVVLPIGYPAHKPPEQERYPIHKNVFLESYNGRIADPMFSALGFTGHIVQGNINRAKDAVKNMHKRLKKE